MDMVDVDWWVMVGHVAMAQNYPKMDGFPTKHDHFCGSLLP